MPPPFATLRLPGQPDVQAPDGSDVRVLLSLCGGSMAHFELAPGKTSLAVVHRTVEELWYILGGHGEMWRRDDSQAPPSEETVSLEAGVCLSIPVGVRFQFRSLGPEPLAAIGVTMPPWPGPNEAVVVTGKWHG